MTMLEMLKEYLGSELETAYRCSKRHLMEDPKRGREEEFRKAKEKIGHLEYLIARLEAETGE